MEQSSDGSTRSRVDARTYRQIMGGFTTGVAVVATKSGEELCGMTVNSLTSVSLDPPLLLFCLMHGSRTLAGVTASGRFSVSLLARSQKRLSNIFARPGHDHFAEVSYRVEQGLPVFPGAIATLKCDVYGVNRAGDHDIVIGEVISCAEFGGDPLVFYRGHYIRNISYDDYPAPMWWA